MQQFSADTNPRACSRPAAGRGRLTAKRIPGSSRFILVSDETVRSHFGSPHPDPALRRKCGVGNIALHASQVCIGDIFPCCKSTAVFREYGFGVFKMQLLRSEKLSLARLTL